jgi:dolichol-phosphate mannosyltransferase
MLTGTDMHDGGAAIPDAAPVTVIVPCFDEEAGLPSLLARLDAMRENGAEDWRFLFVDDGSTDGTWACLLRAARERRWMSVVRHAANRGLGAALRTGFRMARSPVVCTIDSDCTYPPERLPELVTLARLGGEIVTASVWHPATTGADGSRLRLVLSRTASSLYQFLIGQDVYTFTCLFRAYRREAIAGIRFRTNGFAAVAEIMLRAMLAGHRVREVPMQLGERRFGESKLKIGNAIASHLRLLTMTAAMVSVRGRPARAGGSGART